ncbi:zinc finger, CCHC-type containing protein [Tanacetum coccineum]
MVGGSTVKEMTTNFGKLNKFEGHDFRQWQKKMHFLLITLKVMYVLTTPMPEFLEDDTMEAIRRRDSLESKYMAEDASSKKFLESDKGKGKEVDGPSVSMMEEGGKNKNNKQNKGEKRGFKDNGGSGSIKKPKLACWKCGKTSHFKKDCRSGNKKENASANAFYVQVDAIAWWIDSGATTHVYTDRCWFKTYEPMEDGSVLYMGDDHFTHVHRKGSVVLEFSSKKTITLFNVFCVPKLCKNLIFGPVLNKCGYKQVYESDKYILSKSGVFVGFGYYNSGTFMLNLKKVPDSSFVYMSSSTVVNSSLWHARLGNVHYKRMLEMSKDDLIPAIDENKEKCNEKYVITFIDDASRIIHETTAPYTPQKNGVAERKNRALKEMVNAMLSYSGLSEGFWGEAMAVVRLSDPKRKTLGEKDIDCIFVGYAEHSKAYSFIPKDIIPNLNESQRDDHSNDVPSETPEPHKSKRAKKAKLYGSDFQLYLVEESRDQIGSQYSYCNNIEEDPRTDNKATQSRDVAFWKKAIDIEIGFRQKEGINYFDTYASVARITTIRLLIALATIHNLAIHQMDVKTIFLNGDLEEEVYMKQPEGFVMPDNEHKMFSMKDMGEVDVILDCSPVSTPMDPEEKLMPNTSKPAQLEYSKAIGCLMYAMISTRRDIAYAVDRLSRISFGVRRIILDALEHGGAFVELS